MNTKVVSMAELAELAGTDLGYSPWFQIDQKRIDVFADATDDDQWIHVDPERAKSGPFGQPIAHGYLTLAMVVPMWITVLDVRDARTKVNYGLNKVRFPAPVPVGSRVRLGVTLRDAEDIRGPGVQLTLDTVVEVEGSDKPACVAQLIFRYYS
ncbi:MaoC family dehydratase [Micromonospora sp. NPDC047707]|uniref:MaoC family dehydratase n=1 Tax=Micromonospora sp. NPDC047707 TaxID=3154498 RepID=UPI0034525F4E